MTRNHFFPLRIRHGMKGKTTQVSYKAHNEGSGVALKEKIEEEDKPCSK